MLENKDKEQSPDLEEVQEDEDLRDPQAVEEEVPAPEAADEPDQEPAEDDESWFDHVLGSNDSEDEDKKALQVQDQSNQLSFDEQVIEKIVTIAAQELDGVALTHSNGGFFNLKSRSGIAITVEDNDSVALDLNIVLLYGKSAPEAFHALQSLIKERLQTITGLRVTRINVHVDNILTEEEFSQRS